MRTNSKVVPLVLRPRFEFGVDWGRQRPVLLRYGTKEVQLIPGHRAWAGRGSTAYFSQRIVLVDYSVTQKDRAALHPELLKGRLSQRAWYQVLPRLQSFLELPGFDPVLFISPKHTIVVEAGS